MYSLALGRLDSDFTCVKYHFSILYASDIGTLGGSSQGPYVHLRTVVPESEQVRRRAGLIPMIPNGRLWTINCSIRCHHATSYPLPVCMLPLNYRGRSGLRSA